MAINDQIYFQNQNKLYKKGYYSSVLEINKNEIHNLLLFPNPATDLIHIKFPTAIGEKYKISILNYLGQEVFMEENKDQIDLRHFACGVYSLIVKTSESKYYRGSFIKAE